MKVGARSLKIINKISCLLCIGIMLFLLADVFGQNKRDIKSVRAKLCVSSKGDTHDDELANIIRSSFEKKITFDIDVYPTLSSDALEIAYDRNLVIEGRGDDYSLIIKGEDIEDYTNELDMKIEIKNKNKDSNSFYFLRESKEDLPGKVMLKVRNDKYFKKNVYLYNKIKGKYELLDVKDMTWELDENMKCLVTDEDVNAKKIDYDILIYVAIGIFVLIIIYVIVKKKYWFW